MAKENFNLNDGATKDLTLEARAEKAVAKMAGSRAILVRDFFEKPWEQIKNSLDFMEEQKDLEHASSLVKKVWEETKISNSRLTKHTNLQPPKQETTEKKFAFMQKQDYLTDADRKALLKDIGNFFDFVKENQTKIPKYDFYTDMETYEDDINLVKAGFENKPQEKIDYLSDCYKVFGLTSNVADKKEKQVSDDFEANKKQLKNAETKAKIGFVKEVEKTGYPIDKHDREKVAEHLAKAVKVSISLIHDEDENLSQDEIKETKSPKAIISTAYNMNLETSEPEGIQKLPEKTVFNPLMEQMVFEMYETMEKAHKDPEYKKAVVKSRKELKKLTSLKDNMESLRGAVKDNFFYANLQKTSNNKPETGKMDNELKVSLAKKAMQANRN